MADKKGNAAAKKQKRGQPGMIAIYLLLVAAIAGYAVSSNIFVGALAFVILVVALVMEFKYSVREEGVGRSIYDIVVALVAVAVFWAALVLVLGTSSPVNVVASCSMLPNLHRGDLVLLHGISNMTYFLQSHGVPVVNVSPERMNETVANMDTEFLAFFAYDPSNASKIVEMADIPNPMVGLYNTRCISGYEAAGEYQYLDRCEVQSQSQNLIKYNYTMERVSTPQGIEYIPQTSTITIANQTINENYSNPIIVYQTTSEDSFSGDIVHRLVAAIRSGNQYYLLTKGDNNGGLDIQFENYPVQQGQAVGYVIAGIPLLGYVRLIMSGQLALPSGCNTTISRQ